MVGHHLKGTRHDKIHSIFIFIIFIKLFFVIIVIVRKLLPTLIAWFNARDYLKFLIRAPVIKLCVIDY